MMAAKEILEQHCEDQSLIDSVTVKDLFDMLKAVSADKGLDPHTCDVAPALVMKESLLAKTGSIKFSVDCQIIVVEHPPEKEGLWIPKIVVMSRALFGKYNKFEYHIMYPKRMFDETASTSDYEYATVPMDKPPIQWSSVNIDERMKSKILLPWVIKKIIRWRLFNEIPTVDIATYQKD